MRFTIWEESQQLNVFRPEDPCGNRQAWTLRVAQIDLGQEVMLRTWRTGENKEKQNSCSVTLLKPCFSPQALFRYPSLSPILPPTCFITIIFKSVSSDSLLLPIHAHLSPIPRYGSSWGPSLPLLSPTGFTSGGSTQSSFSTPFPLLSAQPLGGHRIWAWTVRFILPRLIQHGARYPSTSAWILSHASSLHTPHPQQAGCLLWLLPSYF